MGSTINVRCTGCGFHGEEQPWGRGMAWNWDYFELRLFRCVPCRRLASARVLQPLRTLRTAAGSTTDWPGPLNLTRQHLVDLLVAARTWPNCAQCSGQLGGKSERGDAPKRCPNCGAGLLVADGDLLWD